MVSSVRSNPGFPLLTNDSRFGSFVDDGSVVAPRGSSGVPTRISRDEPEGGGLLAADDR